MSNFPRRFDDSSVSGVTQLKSSVQKGIKNKLVEQFPNLANYIDDMIPKKDTLRIVKWLVATISSIDYMIGF